VRGKRKEKDQGGEKRGGVSETISGVKQEKNTME